MGHGLGGFGPQGGFLIFGATFIFGAEAVVWLSSVFMSGVALCHRVSVVTALQLGGRI